MISTILLIAVYAMNYLSVSGKFGVSQMFLGEIFPFDYMPPGWTFMRAWTAIYLFLGVYIIRSWTTAGERSETNKSITPLFWISCLLNIVRLLLTGREYYEFSIIVIAGLFIVLYMIMQKIHGGSKEKPARQMQVPFGLYTGRVSLATTVLGSSQFVYLYNQQLPLTDMRTGIVIGFGIALTVRLYGKRRNNAHLLIALFAFAGIIFSLVG